MSSNLKVLIIGSALGGLALAQSLKRSGVSFEIFERDNTPFDRPQGYRLHLDEDAINTAREVLSPEQYQVFEKTSHWTQPYTSIMKHDSLRVVKQILTKDDLGTEVWPEKDADSAPIHANVDRAILRQIFLIGLGDSIRWGAKFQRYEPSSDGGVIAHFADGSTASGSLLVGADGINSRVRKQCAPELGTMDAGITAIYGRLPIDAVRKLGPKEALEDIFLIASDSRKVFLGLGSVIFPMPPDEAAKQYIPGTEVQSRDSYAVCIVGGKHEYFPKSTRTATSRDLQEIAASLVEDWNSDAAPLVREGDVESFFAVHMRTSVPGALSKPKNVTLLGDSVHPITSSLGRGANLAMRHGALLGRRLRKVADGEGSLVEEYQAYETAMTEYGFKIVREAAQIGQQRADQRPLDPAVVDV